jgi:hypothetical protein|tara:strand:- start:30 stop:1262 length:1233 start_codon:yes stop_codon:yes gene_type:complete
MAVRVSKSKFNLREKLSELDKPTGIKGNELMRSDTAQDVRDLISAGRKNKLINGAMAISQRGTSFDSDTNSDYTLDRFQLANSGSITFDATVTQDSSAPDGFRKSLKISPDTVETSMSDSENAMIMTKLEGQHLQDFAFGTSSAKKLTISFYAKSGSTNNGHQYTLQIRKYDDSNNRNMVTRAFTVNNYWQRYTMTFDGDTAENIRNDNGLGMQIIWHLATGPNDIHGASTTFGRTVNTSLYSAVTGQSNFLDNTSNEFYLTGCQLEVGENATEFEHRSHAEELALCQRYGYRLGGLSRTYQVVGNGFIGLNGSTICAKVLVHLPTTMRTHPAVSVIGTDSFIGHTGAAFSDMSVTLTSNQGGVWDDASSGNHIWLDFGRASGGSPTNGTACVVYTAATNQGEVFFNAEL